MEKKYYTVLLNHRPAQKGTSKHSRSTFVEKSHNEDPISRNQSIKIVVEEPTARTGEVAEVKTVSCIAYGKFANSEFRETNVDSEDYTSVRRVP